MTTLLALVALVSSAGRTLAQNTPEENNPNVDAPFVRHIRADRPGQTISAQVLRPGRFQLETGILRTSPASGSSQLMNSATLRIGFFNSMELRITQAYQPGLMAPATAEGPLRPAGLAPLVVGSKLMLSPNYDTRTQVAMVVETPVPYTGNPAEAVTGLQPAGRLLVSEQLGQRFGLEGNFGFGLKGLTVADLERGQFLGSLALNGPLGPKAGFFVEGYGAGRAVLTSGYTAGLYYSPLPMVRFDVNAGRVVGGPAAGTATLGAGFVLKFGK